MMNNRQTKDKLKELFVYQEENISLLQPFGIVKKSLEQNVKNHLLNKRSSLLDDLICNEESLGQLVKDINQLSALKNQLTTFMHQVVAQQNEMIAELCKVAC